MEPLLYPVERTLSLFELLSTFVPDAAKALDSAMSQARMQREGVALLLNAQARVYQHGDLKLTMEIAESLIGLHLEAGEYEGARLYADQLLHLLQEGGSAPDRAKVYGLLGVIDHMQGEPDSALVHITQGSALLDQSAHRPLMGYLSCHAAAILCYMGKHAEAEAIFAHAADAFRTGDHPIGKAWLQHTYAREVLIDQGDYGRAAADLSDALLVLEGRTSVAPIIDNLIATTSCLLRLSQVDRARVLIQRLETLVGDPQRRWYHPELCLLKGQLALADNHLSAAQGHLYAGVGAVSRGGDVRQLSALYRVLGLALERDRQRHADARDAFERSIACGRARGRRTHLAQALQSAGNHLKRMATRPTERARGSGYLFESHQLMVEMRSRPAPAEATSPLSL
jgi:tetratricopeptide (TPR) repeat protein